MPSPIHNRRALHVPFFPAPPPSASSPFPKYPSASSSSSSSSSSSASQPQQGFFPTYLAPPPPALPTFPANLSSLIFPTSRSAPPRRAPATHLLLLPALLLPLLALALAAAFFLRRIRPARGFDARSDSVRLFQPSIADSKRPASSEFLYLGTLVDSHGHQNHPHSSSADASLQVGPSPPLSKTGSPELRPLPPLSRQIPQGHGNADGGSSPAEEFYSPNVASSSGNASPPAMVEKCGSAISTVSSISATLLSPSPPVIPSPPFGLSPSNSSGRSLKTMTERNLASVDVGFLYSPLPSPPPLRPMTPSPPKRKPASLPLPFPAKTKEFDGKIKTFDFSYPNPVESLYDNDFTHSHFATNAPSAPPPPPPPPPPPQPSRPYCFRDGPVRKLKDLQRPDLVPDKKVRNPSALEESSKNAKDEDTPKPKLKPLLWDKVRASSDRTMVWDQLRSSSFQVNEEMIETLFIRNVTSTATEEMNKGRILSPLTQENTVLDPKKSQNIAILLRALNVTKEEVCEALLEGNADSLGTELLETLLKMAPNKEEEYKLKEFKEDSVIKLGSAEKFLRAVLEIPFAFKRVEAMLYIANFDSEVNFLKKSFETLEAACEELKSSRLFLKLLEAVLKTGNRMNVGTNRGDAHAFKLDTLLKLVDIKGTDGKTTLLHFVVQEITRAECSRLCGTKSLTAKTLTLQSNHECMKLGLQVVAGLGGELSNVKKAAVMDSDVLSGYVTKLAGGIGKITNVLRLNEASAQSGQHWRFNAAMTDFLKKTENEIVKLQDQESMALSLVRELTEYFHGDSAKEAHPFRIFMVVRDFLVILDQVCKEVGRINEQGLLNSTRQHSVPIH